MGAGKNRKRVLVCCACYLLICPTTTTEKKLGLGKGRAKNAPYLIKHFCEYSSQILAFLRILEYNLFSIFKAHLQSCLAEIRAFAAEKLKLELNEKTQIFPVSEGVDYLGWHFYLTDTGKVIRRLRTSNKRRFKRRLKAFQEKYRSGGMDYDEISRSLSSYEGHLQHGHTWKLKAKIYGNFVLTKAPKREQRDITGEKPAIE